MIGKVDDKGISCVSCGIFTPWDNITKTDEGDYCPECAKGIEEET